MPALGVAQTDRGTISGVIMDGTKAAMPGVVVRVINTATNATAELVSSETGSYNAASLPPGVYRLEATIPGFQTSVVEGIRLTAGATSRIDVTMSIGQVTESINVVAATLMQTSDAKVSTNVSNELIDELPLVVGGAMRTVFDLVSIVPEAKGAGGSVSLGGGQSAAYGATLDGISVNTNRNAQTSEAGFLSPSVEAITEFSVETNGFKPEFGQAGGGSITFASKSGTNQFHGSLFNFLRNDALDSKGFFETEKSVYRQNNFGASFGGPVLLPKYNGRNRTFFFASYEGFVNRQAQNAARFTVPTPEMYNGDFSNWVNANGQRIVIYDPATTRPNPSGTGLVRDPFPGNRIPVERFSSVALQYLNNLNATSVMVPNVAATPGTFAYINNNYQSAGGTNQESTYKYSMKIDQQLSNAHRFAYLFNRTTNLSTPTEGRAAGLPEPFNSSQWESYDADVHRVSWDWIGALAVNHFSWGMNTFFNDGGSLNVGKNWADRVCIPNAFDCNKNMGIISFSEFSTWGSSSLNGTYQPRWSIKNDTTFIRGNHTIKTGMTFDHQRAEGIGEQQIGGAAGFSFFQTGIPGGTTLNNAGGSSFASFLLGAANNGGTETFRWIRQIYPYWSFYAQDDWRVHDKLVINYGARYEFTQPPREHSDQYTDFSPTKPNPGVNGYPGALIFAGEGPGREGTRSLVPGYYGAISPRFSLAFTPLESTTVRFGVGRSYGRVTVLAGSSHFDGFAGVYRWTAPDSVGTPLFMLDEGLPAYLLPPVFDPTFSNNVATHWWNGKEATRPATYDTWTVSVQRQIRPGLMVEANYNGSHGNNLQAQLLNPNQVPMAVVNDLIDRYGTTQAVALLNSQVTSPQAVAAGIAVPYPNFTDPSVQISRTVAQALRAFPQYQQINVATGGGDKTGSSRYHAAVFKLNQRFSNVTVMGSYAFSRISTDADSFSGSTGSLDAARPELNWSRGIFDIPHAVKVSTVAELPFGPGQRWLNSGTASRILGGWRVAAIQSYFSGTPISVTSNAPLPIFNHTNRPNVTGEDWRAPMAGDKFDPLVDKYLNPAAFVQPVGELGNAPRTNPDVRTPWSLIENISVAKSLNMTSSISADIRFEVFNLFNRVRWGNPVTNRSSNAFGDVTSQSNNPRQMQLGFKLYW
jgi:hypothetical protein